MPLYRLEPTFESVGDEDWSASTHKTLVYVQASSEKEAREIAHQEFWIAADKKSDGQIPVNPWKDPDKVLCTEVNQVPDGLKLLQAKQ